MSPDQSRELLTVADHDRTLQAWVIQHLPYLSLANETTETISGVALVIKALYEHAQAPDAAAAARWCDLSLSQLAARLKKARSTIQDWVKAAARHGLILESGRRRRPDWSKLLPLMQAAAARGQIAQQPLFAPAVEIEIVPVAEIVPVTGTPAGTIRTDAQPPPEPPPVRFVPLTGTNRTDAEVFFDQNSRGGWGGLRPFQGAESPHPPRPGESAGKIVPVTGTIRTDAAGPGVPVTGTQLTLEFEQRTDARLESLVSGIRSLQETTREILRAVVGRKSRKADAAQNPPHDPAEERRQRRAEQIDRLKLAILNMDDGEILSLANRAGATCGCTGDVSRLRRWPTTEMLRCLERELTAVQEQPQ